MEKVYNIYVNGKIEAQNISIDEELATVENYIRGLKDSGASEHDKELLAEIENGASIEIIEAEESEDSNMILEEFKPIEGVEIKRYAYKKEYFVEVITDPNPTEFCKTGERTACLCKYDCTTKLEVYSSEIASESFDEFLENVLWELEYNTNYNTIGWFNHESDGLTDYDGYVVSIVTQNENGLITEKRNLSLNGIYHPAEWIAKKELATDEIARITVFDINGNLLSVWESEEYNS